MTAFKAIVTLILISVIGLAVLIGPLTESGGKETPGQQSPAVPTLPSNSPATGLLLLGLVGMPLVGIGKRLVNGS